MKIFLFADTAAPHTRRWAKWFARRGHEVHVVSFNPNALDGYKPAIVHILWKPKFGNSLIDRVLKIPFILTRLRTLLRQYQPDLVHAHSAGGYAWAALISGFRPYIVTPWGTDILVDVERSRINKFITGLALRSAALVTTDGFHFVEILGRFGIAKEDLLVHTFGTNIHHFCPGPDDAERQILGIGEGPIIISTRTLNPVHSVETFVRALPDIHKAYPLAKFIIVGDGADRDNLETLVSKLGLSSVTYFTGMVEELRMRNLLRIADIYVSTSLMDAGLAASTAEAMATELPVVQTDNSDNAYWTPNGEGGLLVSNGEPSAISEAVIRLLGDIKECRRMGKRNRQMVIKEYNMDKEMTRIETEYKRLATRINK
jgi:L-malate glycosyltransferase